METFLPRYIEPGSGIPRALFPGYLFVRMNDRWQKLRNTYGVIDVVMMGGKPDYVPKAVMKALRNNMDKDGIVTLPRQRKPELREAVEIKVGAWQGFTGLYDGLNSEGRIRVLLSMFGREAVLTFKRQSSIQVVNA
jgi:transcription antitermination factor NusG